jgi:hypothetical protein
MISNKEFSQLYAESAQKDIAKIREPYERIAELEAENRRLREALYPLAKMADKIDLVRAKAPGVAKNYEASARAVGLRYEDAVRARAALSQEEKP